jgi:hypothetical protein
VFVRYVDRPPAARDVAEAAHWTNDAARRGDGACTTCSTE